VIGVVTGLGMFLQVINIRCVIVFFLIFISPFFHEDGRLQPVPLRYFNVSKYYHYCSHEFLI
jgi:hypothetical protein